MRRVDRYCILHPNFGIKNLMLFIVIGNAIVWLFGSMDTSNTLIPLLEFSAKQIFTKGQIWRLVTFVLVPTGGRSILFLVALYFYYFIGKTLENQWGAGKFTIYYLSGMLLNILYGTLMWLITKNDISINAEYLNLSMFFAFATLYPNMQVLLFFIIPINQIFTVCYTR